MSDVLYKPCGCLGDLGVHPYKQETCEADDCLEDWDWTNEHIDDNELYERIETKDGPMLRRKFHEFEKPLK